MSFLVKFCVCYLAVSWAFADDTICLEDIKTFLDKHSTAIMQKDELAFADLFSEDYQQIDNQTQNQPLKKADIVKIYKNNFLVAKLIINKINILDCKLSEREQQVTLKTHIFNRYLIEFQGKQNILNQEEDWDSRIGLIDGQLRYLNTQKTVTSSP